jgi:hypothetical protein
VESFPDLPDELFAMSPLFFVSPLLEESLVTVLEEPLEGPVVEVFVVFFDESLPDFDESFAILPLEELLELELPDESFDDFLDESLAVLLDESFVLLPEVPFDGLAVDPCEIFDESLPDFLEESVAVLLDEPPDDLFDEPLLAVLLEELPEFLLDEP